MIIITNYMFLTISQYSMRQYNDDTKTIRFKSAITVTE